MKLIWGELSSCEVETRKGTRYRAVLYGVRFEELFIGMMSFCDGIVFGTATLEDN